MITPGLTVKVEHLIGHPEKQRDFSGERDVSLRLGDTTVNGPMKVTGDARGTVDGVYARFWASAEASLSCVRCLTKWTAPVETEGSRHFTKAPDEDGYSIVEGEIDVSEPARDELALALPAAPVHDPECKGLCPICGTDLNTEPCDGHGDDSDSPFSVLKDLFTPDSP